MKIDFADVDVYDSHSHYYLWDFFRSFGLCNGALRDDSGLSVASSYILKRISVAVYERESQQLAIISVETDKEVIDKIFELRERGGGREWFEEEILLELEKIIFVEDPAIPLEKALEEALLRTIKKISEVRDK